MYYGIKPIIQIHVHPVAAHPLDVPPPHALVVVRVPQQNSRASLRHLGAFGERSSSSFFSLPYLLIHLPSSSRPLRRHGAPHRGPESPCCACHALVPRWRLYSHRRAVQRRRAVGARRRLESGLSQGLSARRRGHVFRVSGGRLVRELSKPRRVVAPTQGCKDNLWQCREQCNLTLSMSARRRWQLPDLSLTRGFLRYSHGSAQEVNLRANADDKRRRKFESRSQSGRSGSICHRLQLQARNFASEHHSRRSGDLL